MENKTKQKNRLIKDALALFLITLVSGLALSYIYEITKEPIRKQQEANQAHAYQEVFKEAKTFVIVDELMDVAESVDLIAMNSKFKGVRINEVNQALDGAGELLGYIVKVSNANSYNEPIVLTVGLDLEGTVTGVEILKINETAGLGMKAASPDFTGQFVNKTVIQFEATQSGASADNQINAISGATITTDAVVNAVNAAITFVTEYAMN